MHACEVPAEDITIAGMTTIWLACQRHPEYAVNTSHVGLVQENLHAMGICLDLAGNVIKQAQITCLADSNGALS